MASSSTSAHPGQTRADQEAILATIYKFFDGLRTKSPDIMLSTVLPNSHATLNRPPLNASTTSQSQIIQVTMSDLISRVTSSAEIMEENIALATWQDGDDGDRYGGRRTEVHVDHDVAVAWTPFEVRKDGEVISVGTNVFSLVKSNVPEKIGEWVICGVADTSRTVA